MDESDAVTRQGGRHARLSPPDGAARAERLAALFRRVVEPLYHRQVILRTGLGLDCGGEGVVVALPIITAILQVDFFVSDRRGDGAEDDPFTVRVPEPG